MSMVQIQSIPVNNLLKSLQLEPCLGNRLRLPSSSSSSRPRSQWIPAHHSIEVNNLNPFHNLIPPLPLSLPLRHNPRCWNRRNTHASRGSRHPPIFRRGNERCCAVIIIEFCSTFGHFDFFRWSIVINCIQNIRTEGRPIDWLYGYWYL